MIVTKTSWRVMTLFCALLSYGCSTVPVQRNVDRVEIAKAVYLTLPSAEEITRSFDATQLLVADYEEQSLSFQAQLEVRPGKITIVGITMWGGTLFSISYDGAILSAHGMVERNGIDAEYLLADVLLATWDAEWVSARLRGAVLEISGSDDSRIVSRDGEPLIEISYETAGAGTGRTRFNHLERGYRLDIRTAEFTES